MDPSKQRLDLFKAGVKRHRVVWLKPRGGVLRPIPDASRQCKRIQLVQLRKDPCCRAEWQQNPDFFGKLGDVSERCLSRSARGGFQKISRESHSLDFLLCRQVPTETERQLTKTRRTAAKLRLTDAQHIPGRRDSSCRGRIAIVQEGAQ